MQYLTKNLGTFHNLLLHPVLEMLVIICCDIVCYTCNSMIEETWNITIHGFAENVSNRVKQVSASTAVYLYLYAGTISQQTATRLLETIKVSAYSVFNMYVIFLVYFSNWRHFSMLVEMDYQ